MSKITTEAFARLWGQVAQLPRKQLVLLRSLMNEKIGPYQAPPSQRTGRSRKTAGTPPTEAA